MSGFEQEIRDLTRQRLRLIRESQGTWPFAASLKRLGGQTAHEYEDRFLLELLQNAYDAQPPETSRGQVRFHLCQQQGMPVLYVANTGRPFRRRDVEALSNLALSSKTPGEGIGNKGLGFRSVLRVSEWPEVYSTNPIRRAGGLGYCFGFARPDDLAKLTSNSAEQTQLEKEVPPSALPIPRAVADPWVSRLLELDFVTVVRLPLTRPGAFDLVRRRLLDFGNQESPALLFLDRLRLLDVTFDGVDERDFSLTRRVAPASVAVPPDVRAAMVDTGGGRYAVFERKVDAHLMVEQIEEGIRAGDLSEEWRGWTGSAHIGIAIPLDDVVEGRIYTFLPMSTPSPINGHMNAPFYTKLARLEASLKVGLNEFLMDQLAHLASATADWLVGSMELVWRRVATDLVSWTSEHGERFRNAAEAACRVPMVPTLAKGKSSWSPLHEAIRWPDGVGQRFFSPIAVSRAGSRPILDPAIGQARLERLQESATALWGQTLKADDQEVGEIAENVAARVIRKGNVKRWNSYYEDLATLAQVFGPDVLKRRSILVDQSGKLRRSGPWDEKNRAEKPIFLPPVTSDGAAGDIGSIQLPAGLATIVPMLHAEVKLLRQDGTLRVRTEISKVLRQADLVREYKKEHVLRALAEASGRAKSNRRRSEILQQLFGAFKASPRGDGLDHLNPMVPARAGWIPASEAVFGDGWNGTMGPGLALVVASITNPFLKALFGHLLLPPEEWPFEVSDQDLLTRFLNRIGVADGIRPSRVKVDPIRRDGEFWNPADVANLFPSPADERAVWVCAANRKFTRPNHPRTPYRSDDLWDLPGHMELQDHSSDLRMAYARLITESLGHWAPETLEFRFRRYKAIHNTSQDEQRWPSLAGAMLSEVPWLPVTGPGNRDHPEFILPRDAWHFDDPNRRPPPFVSLVERSVATILDHCSTCRERLAKLGLRSWSDPAAAHDRLECLARVVEQGEVRESDIDALKKALREAFADCLEQGLLQPDSPIVVQQAHQLHVIGSNEVVYLPNNPRGFVDHLLESLDFGVAVVSPTDPAQIPTDWANRLLPAAGLAVEVLVGSEPVQNSVEHPLLLDRADWLVEWLLLTSELSRNRFLHLGPRALEEMVGKLRRVRLVQAASVHVRVDGSDVRLPPHLAGCVPLHDDGAPTLVVSVREAGTGKDVIDWTVLGDAADALAELLGQPGMASELRLSANELKRVMQGEFRRPLSREWALALRSPEPRVREIIARTRAHIEPLRELLVPAIFVLAGSKSAGKLRTADAPTVEDLRGELLQHFGAEGADRLIREAQQAESISAFRVALGLDYESFNLALEALGPPYRPLHDREEHRRVTQSVLARSRGTIAEALRVCYLPIFDARGDLQPYVSLRQGPDLQPTHEDLHKFASPPESMLLSRIGDWLSAHECPSLGAQVPDLPSVADTRSRNLEVVRGFLKEVQPLINAWVAKRSSAPGTWTIGSIEDDISSLDSSGWLDFRILSPDAIPDLLHRVGGWPEEMPRTRDLDTLGLAHEDVDWAKDANATEKEVRRRQQSTITVATEEVDAEDLAAVAEAVGRTVDDRILQASKRQRSPVAPPTPKIRRSGARKGPFRPSDRGMTDVQRNAIGLAGEVIAYRWLLTQYDEANGESWVSGNRSVLLGGKGDDALGYDFVVHQRSQSIYFDVKATAGDETAFEMTENEMRVAHAATRRTPYRIIFIRNVLNPELDSIRLRRIGTAISL